MCILLSDKKVISHPKKKIPECMFKAPQLKKNPLPTELLNFEFLATLFSSYNETYLHVPFYCTFKSAVHIVSNYGQFKWSKTKCYETLVVRSWAYFLTIKTIWPLLKQWARFTQEEQKETMFCLYCNAENTTWNGLFVPAVLSKYPHRGP